MGRHFWGCGLALACLFTTAPSGSFAQSGALDETYFGTVRARDIVSLSYESRGCILEVSDLAKTLRKAKQGQELVKLDDNRARLAVEMAQARIADLEASVEERRLAVNYARADHQRRKEEGTLAEEEFQRNSVMEGRGLINANTMDTVKRRHMDSRFATERAAEAIANAEAALTRAEIALEIGKLDLETMALDLDKITLRAPFDGVLVGFEANVGDCVQDGALAGRIYRPDQKSVDVFFPIARLTAKGSTGLSAGANVTVTRTNGDACTGTITRIDTEADTETQFVEATVDIDPACAPSIFLNEAVEIQAITPPVEES